MKLNIEKIITFPAIFIALIPLSGILLGWLKLIYPAYVFALSFFLTFIIYSFIKKKEQSNDLKLAPFLLVCALSLFVFTYNYIGAVNQVYLEDGDPYGYAVMGDYIAKTHTFLRDKDIKIETYSEPDNQGFNILVSVLYQTTGLMNQTLKFIVPFLLGYMLLMFFFFIRVFFKSKDDWLAMFLTFVLAAAPAFLTRFIFTTPYAIFIFICALYLVYKTLDNNQYFFGAGLVISSLLLTHHLVSLIFGLFLFAAIIFELNIWILLSGAIGGIISFSIFWIPELVRYTVQGFKEHIGIGHQKGFYLVGTADKPYTILDFISSQGYAKVNSPVGLGVLICLLFVFSILMILYFKEFKSKRVQTAAMWCCLSLVGLFGFYFPVRLLPFRWWPFIAISFVILLGFGYKRIPYKKYIIPILIIAIFMFTFVPKIKLNLLTWSPSPGMQNAPGFTEGHIWLMNNLEPNTNVFSFVSGNKLQGFNMFFCEWCTEEIDLKSKFLNLSVQDMYSELSLLGYDYLIFDLWYFDEFGVNETQKQLEAIMNSTLFTPIYQNQGFIAYKRSDSIELERPPMYKKRKR
jgi:hypothetical protein